MSHSTIGAAILLPLVSLLLSPHATTAQQRPEPPGALPYELAFDLRQFLSSTAFAVTQDGRRVAYDVRRPLPDSNLSARFLPNGTPSSVAGSKISITDRANGQTIWVCPGGNCWRPSWSPDGLTLAFYSDAGGPPQLWVYELVRGRTRKLSDWAVKAKLWTGDEPRWSTDGRVLYVPLAPEGEYRSPLDRALPPGKPRLPRRGRSRFGPAPGGSAR